MKFKIKQLYAVLNKIEPQKNPSVNKGQAVFFFLVRKGIYFSGEPEKKKLHAYQYPGQGLPYKCYIWSDNTSLPEILDQPLTVYLTLHHWELFGMGFLRDFFSFFTRGWVLPFTPLLVQQNSESIFFLKHIVHLTQWFPN